MGESTAAGGEDNQQDDGGRRPGDPQVFGVDGVSKTGSTSKDQQIGFTDGQGGRGANFEALQNATRQQTTAAVAAADAARDAGASQTAAQAAVSNILESYDPSAVDRQGRITDSGQGLISRAVQEAIEDTAEFDRISARPQDAQAAEAFRAAEVAGVRAPPNIGFDITQPLDITQPAGTGFADAETARIANLTPNQAAAQGVTVAEQRAAQAATRGQTVNPVTGIFEGPNLVQQFTEAGLDPAAGQEAQRERNAAAQLRREMALAEINRNLGITTLPEAATAASVLRGPDDVIQEQRTAQAVAQPPIGRSMGGANELFGGTGTTDTAPGVEDSVVGGPIAATGGPMERVDPTQIGGISVPTPPPDRFKTNAQRDFFENLASLPGGQAQFDAELANLENRGFTGRRIAKVISEGGVPNYDPSAPEGFRIRGATGTNFVDLPFLGTTPISTYTGLDNPNAPADTSSDEPVTAKAPNDPCPAGYRLVDGVCQPSDDLMGPVQTPSPPGSDFQINPTTGLPTVFQPRTVATPVGPINPFVLQPSPPVGINPPAQGIQALSPTGAALGRQV